MKKFLALLFFLFISPALADNVLVLSQGYNGAAENVKARLEAYGHTVTITTSEPTSSSAISNYQQIWDVRYDGNSLSTSTQEVYRAFVQNGGFLYMTAENNGCCVARNGKVAAIITAAGGGSTTINYTPSIPNNSQISNPTYVTEGTTVTYAAASSINNSQGTWLTRDSNGVVSAMLWIGNAGDLGSGYTGTILVVSDINWTDNSYYTSENQTALDDYIGGVVAGTVGGTITESGNGSAATSSDGGGSSTPVYSSSITQLQQAKVDAWLNRGSNSSGVHVDQIGNYNNITVLQKNHKDNYIKYDGAGNNNTVNLTQKTDDGNGSGHYLEIINGGNQNSITVLQDNNNSKKAFVINDGSNNTLNLTQRNGGNHYLDVETIGNGHNVTVVQEGSGSHAATIKLNNAGGSSTLNLTQSGTTNQVYSIEQSCSTPSGCSVSVTQQ